MAIKEGARAPAVTLYDATGAKVALKDFNRTNLIVYFYPRDTTPGCTKEACAFRDLMGEFSELGFRVVGISPDNSSSHQKFISAQALNFLLLSDPEKTVMAKYGAFGEKVMYGKKTMGVIRSTVWIGPDGKVLKHWRRVAKAADHPAKVLEFVRGQ